MTYGIAATYYSIPTNVVYHNYYYDGLKTSKVDIL